MNPFTKRPARAGLWGKYILTLSMLGMIMFGVQQSQAQIIIEIEPPFRDSTNSLVVPGDLVGKISTEQQLRLHATKQPGLKPRVSSSRKSHRVTNRNSQLLYWERWLLGLFR